MSRVIFLSGGNYCGRMIWCQSWAECDNRRVVVDSRLFALQLNARLEEDVRPLAVACAVNVLTNAARKGFDVVVSEDLDIVARRLRHIAKREGMEIVEKRVVSNE